MNECDILERVNTLTSLTVKEIKKLRTVLDKDLFNLINTFFKETGARVEGVDIRYAKDLRVDGDVPLEIVHVAAKVTLHI